jgi:hypothetical protein
LLEVHVAAGHEGSLVSGKEDVDLDDVLLELSILASFDASVSLLFLGKLDVAVSKGLTVAIRSQ